MQKGSDWLLRSGVICACDHKKTDLIPIQYVQEWHMMPPQPSAGNHATAGQFCRRLLSLMKQEPAVYLFFTLMCILTLS